MVGTADTAHFMRVLLLVVTAVHQINGHGFMYTPRSRNYIAFEDGVDGAEAGKYKREHCKDVRSFCGFD